MVVTCEVCGVAFEPPFNDKELGIWLEACKIENRWECTECLSVPVDGLVEVIPNEHTS